MKTDRILEIADLIEAGRDDMAFDMETYGTQNHDCGSAACIAGWANARYGKTGRASAFKPVRAAALNDPHDNPHGYAAETLGLSAPVASSLFVPNSCDEGVSIFAVTADHAVRTLRHLAATGEVDWRATANA